MKCRITLSILMHNTVAEITKFHVTPESNCSSPRYPAPQNREGLGNHFSVTERLRRQTQGLHEGKWLLLLFKRMQYWIVSK